MRHRLSPHDGFKVMLRRSVVKLSPLLSLLLFHPLVPIISDDPPVPVSGDAAPAHTVPPPAMDSAYVRGTLATKSPCSESWISHNENLVFAAYMPSHH